MFDQHNVISVFFLLKRKCHLTSFISVNSAVSFFNVIFARTSRPRRRLYGRAGPSQDLARQTDCLTVLCSQEAPFGSTYDFAPEETHAEEPHGDTDYD